MIYMNAPDIPLVSPQGPGILNILSVDDDQIDRMRLKKTCQKAGLSIEFHEAANLHEMRTKLDEIYFDLIFLDHNLGMDTGLDALKIVMCHEDQVQAIPIMLTSSTDYQIAVDAMRQGCADYIVKEELSVDALIKSVASSIERRALYGELSSVRRSENELKNIFKRFMVSCGPELRQLLRRTLSGIRVVKSEARTAETVDLNMISDVTLLERGCKDLVVFMDDLETVIGEGMKATHSDTPSLRN